MPRRELSAGNFCKDHFAGRLYEGRSPQRAFERFVSIGRFTEVVISADGCVQGTSVTSSLESGWLVIVVCQDLLQDPPSPLGDCVGWLYGSKSSRVA